MPRKLFTSESVSVGHPDKVCDQISDTIVDMIIAREPEARVAVETALPAGRHHGWHHIDITGRAVEENASRIIELYQASEPSPPAG